jgi:hypothetical protein
LGLKKAGITGIVTTGIQNGIIISTDITTINTNRQNI